MQVRNLRERLEEERMAVHLREAEAAALEARLHRLVQVLVGTSRALAAGPPAAAAGAGRLQRTSSQGWTKVRGTKAACVEPCMHACRQAPLGRRASQCQAPIRSVAREQHGRIM